MPALPAIPGFRVQWLTETDSTNRVALDAARAGEPHGLVVVADYQTAGRGRLGRSWSAPPGASLLVSVLLRPGLAHAERRVVVHAAALAMADAVDEATGVVADLKWPNDLLVGGRKLAGILAESVGDAVVVGVGLNVTWEEVPPELAEIATACNLEGGRPADRSAILGEYLARLEARLHSPEQTTADYRARLATLGTRVRVESSEMNVEGVALDVEPSGALIVDTGAETVSVSTADVVHLRDASPPSPR